MLVVRSRERGACGAGVVLERASSGAAPSSSRSKGKYYLNVMGCAMNLSDSERMAGVLEEAGYTCASEAGDADVIIYNTCSIRDKAEQKVYSALGKQAAPAPRRRPPRPLLLSPRVARVHGCEASALPWACAPRLALRAPARARA